MSVVSTLRNSALHNPLVSGLWSGESEVRWVRCANQATVCLEYKLTEHFFPSVNNTPSSPLLLETGRTRGKDGRAPHFLRKRVTLLFTPSLPANSSDCFVFPFCFSGGVMIRTKASARCHCVRAICTIWNVCRDQRFLPHLRATKSFGDRAQVSFSHSKPVMCLQKCC